jgi:glucokinase
MEKKCIGVDVGGTTVKIGLFEVSGELLKKWEIPTRKEEQGKYILDDVAASILEVLKQEEISLEQICGAGLGVPGPVKKDGYVEVCVNLGWKDRRPSEELSLSLIHI